MPLPLPSPPISSTISVNPPLSKPPPPHINNKTNTLPALLPTPNLPIRRLSPAGLHERREKGQCYSCVQKYNPNHRCRHWFLLLIRAGDDNFDLANEGEPPDEEESAVTGDILSLNALAGQVNFRSLRLQGRIGSHTFQVLIDSGSTHNFIKPSVAERAGVAIQPTTQFRVYIENGDFLLCTQFCQQVQLTLQGTEFPMDLFVLPIEGVDIVLGIQWLQQLGRVSHDYSALSMEFSFNGKSIILRGDVSTSPTLVTYNQFRALVHNATISSFCALQPLSSLPIEFSPRQTPPSQLEFPTDLPPQFRDLLQQYPPTISSSIFITHNPSTTQNYRP